jgi:hypothetical protein
MFPLNPKSAIEHPKARNLVLAAGKSPFSRFTPVFARTLG